MSRLSVVTPAFDSAGYLPQLLDSVAALRSEHEHIVIDGGSQDGTVELLSARRDAGLQWVSEPDRGQMHAVNKGLSKITGDLVNWINSDNAYLPEVIDRAVALLDERPEIDAVFGGFDYIDEHGTFRRRYVPRPWSWREYLYRGDYVPTETIVFRRSLLERVPGLDEGFEDGADYDFYLRLLHGRTVHRMAEPMILYRYHPDSKTAKDVWKQQAEHRAIRARWVGNRRQQAVMQGFDGLKRAILPRISNWPEPY